MSESIRREYGAITAEPRQLSEIDRLQADLLEYLCRRKAGGWMLDPDIMRDGFNVEHRGKPAGFLSADALKSDGAEASSAKIIAGVKAKERVAAR